MLARVTECFLPCYPAFFRRLREGHVLPVNAQHAAAVYRALETTQRPIDRLFVSYFNTYCQGDPPDKNVCRMQIHKNSFCVSWIQSLAMNVLCVCDVALST